MMGVGHMPGELAGYNPLPPVAPDPVRPVVHRAVPRGLHTNRVMGGGSRKRKKLGIGTEKGENNAFCCVTVLLHQGRPVAWAVKANAKNAIHLGDVTNEWQKKCFFTT